VLAEDSRYTDAAVGEWTDGLLKAQFHYAIHVVDLVCDLDSVTAATATRSMWNALLDDIHREK